MVSKVKEVELEYESFVPLIGAKMPDVDVKDIVIDMSSGFFDAEGSEKNCSMSIFEPVLTKVMKGTTMVAKSVWEPIIKFSAATKKLTFTKYAGTVDVLDDVRLEFQF